MKRISTYAAALLALLCLTAKGQDNAYKKITQAEASQLLKQVNLWYSSSATYSFVITHAIYAGHTASTPYEEKKGYVKKFTGGSHSNVIGIHTLQNKDHKIIIDSSQKLIVVANAIKDSEKGFSPEELQAALKNCVALKLAEHGKLKSLVIECDKNSAITSYKLDIEKDGRLRAVTLLYAREVKSPTGALVKPKMIIGFDKYGTGVSAEKGELNEGKYFKKENNELFVSDAYKGYTLLDQRTPDEKP